MLVRRMNVEQNEDGICSRKIEGRHYFRGQPAAQPKW